MHWLFAIIGAWIGGVSGAADKIFLGLCAGAVLGWQWSRLRQLGQRVEQLEAREQQAAMQRAIEAARQQGGLPRSEAAPAPAPTPWPQEPQQRPAASPQPDSPRPAQAAAAAAAAPPSDYVIAPAPQPPAPPPIPASAAPAAAAPRPAAPRPAPAPAPPQEDAITAFLRRLLFEGNLPVKIGLVLVFIAVAGFMRYAVDAGWVRFPLELRLAAVAAAALAGLVWGWRNRIARPAFGLSLQGGAIGVLLLNVFASYRVFELLPAGVAFVLVLVLVAGAAALAVLQNSLALALLGFVGGYLAPVLISTGGGNHVALFTYYALLNAAVFGIAWLRHWRALNLVGFAFTFAVGTLWGVEYYRPEHYATVQPFLVLFVAFYIAIAVLHALRGRKPLVDGTLVFGTPLLAFPLQAALLADDRMALAFSALALAGVYAGLALWLRTRRDVELLWQSFAVLALGFATLAVPLAFSARATAATWALEGAALIWLGLRQGRRLPQGIGWLLQALAGLAFGFALLDGGWGAGVDEWRLLNGTTLGLLLLSLAGFAISHSYERQHGGRLPVWAGFLLGLGWWGMVGLRELDSHVYLDQDSGELLGFAALSAALAAMGRRALPWPRLGWIVLLAAAAGAPLALVMALSEHRVLHWPLLGVWLAWVGAMLAALAALRSPQQRGISVAHLGLLWGLALWLGYGAVQLGWRDLDLGDGWQFPLGIGPLAVLLFGAAWRPQWFCWPLADRFAHYRLRWTVPAATLLGALWLLSQFERGQPDPLPFLPLLNPLELSQALLLLLAWRAAGNGADAVPIRAALGVAGLVLLTAMGLRGAHWFGGAPWSIGILASDVAQATLSVLWSLAGVSAWVLGSRRRSWPLWCAGAVLMGIVLLKLMIVDRQYMGDLAGIVSFLAVGGLLVLVGRLAPTPPRHAAEETA